MINQFISNSLAHSTGPDTPWEKPTFELDKASKEQITLKWIQTGLSKEFLRDVINEGSLKAKMIGRSWRIKRSDFEEYVAGLF